MKTFAQYILRNFIWNFFVFWISFSSLLQLFDLLSNSNDVLDRHQGSMLALLEYAIWRVPEIANFLVPFTVLLAALLTLGKLERDNEILAIKAAGAPYYRVLLGFLPAVTFVAIGHFILADQIVPVSINHLLKRNLYIDDTAKQNRDGNPVWIRDGDDIVKIGYIDRSGTALRLINIYTLNENGMLINRVAADQAIYNIETRQWLLYNVSSISISQDNPAQTKTAPDMIWSTSLQPAEFSDLTQKPQGMTLRRLWNFASATEVGVRSTYFYETWLQKRIALPISSILMILLAAPVAHRIRQRDHGLGFGMTIGFCLGFLYFIVEGVVMALGEAGAIHPFFAAWLPAFLFASVGGLALIRSEGL